LPIICTPIGRIPLSINDLGFSDIGLTTGSRMSFADYHYHRAIAHQGFFRSCQYDLLQGRSVRASRLEHALLRPSTAAPRNNTGATMPFRGILVELIAGTQLGHQPIVLYRATPSAFCFGLAGHVFLLYLQLALFLIDARQLRQFCAALPKATVPRAEDVQPDAFFFLMPGRHGLENNLAIFLHAGPIRTKHFYPYTLAPGGYCRLSLFHGEI
jgi:hypothetical protein